MKYLLTLGLKSSRLFTAGNIHTLENSLFLISTVLRKKPSEWNLHRKLGILKKMYGWDLKDFGSWPWLGKGLGWYGDTKWWMNRKNDWRIGVWVRNMNGWKVTLVSKDYGGIYWIWSWWVRGYYSVGTTYVWKQCLCHISIILKHGCLQTEFQLETSWYKNTKIILTPFIKSKNKKVTGYQYHNDGRIIKEMKIVPQWPDITFDHIVEV